MNPSPPLILTQAKHPTSFTHPSALKSTTRHAHASTVQDHHRPDPTWSDLSQGRCKQPSIVVNVSHTNTISHHQNPSPTEAGIAKPGKKHGQCVGGKRRSLGSLQSVSCKDIPNMRSLCRVMVVVAGLNLNCPPPLRNIAAVRLPQG